MCILSFRWNNHISQFTPNILLHSTTMPIFFFTRLLLFYIFPAGYTNHHINSITFFLLLEFDSHSLDSWDTVKQLPSLWFVVISILYPSLKRLEPSTSPPYLSNDLFSCWNMNGLKLSTESVWLSSVILYNSREPRIDRNRVLEYPLGLADYRDSWIEDFWIPNSMTNKMSENISVSTSFLRFPVTEIWILEIVEPQERILLALLALLDQLLPIRPDSPWESLPR